MKEYSITNLEKLRRIDPIVLCCALAMNAMSVITLWAASDKFGMWYVRAQCLASAASIAVMLMLMFIDYDALFQKVKYFLIPLSVALIVWVRYKGVGQMGNQNWIQITRTISVQPSEFVKIFMMISFALHLDRLKDKLDHPLSVLRLAVHGGLFAGMVVWQGDDGMALVYLGILVIMVFGAGVSLWYFAGAGAAGILIFPTLWGHLSTKQQNRILFGFNPDLYPLGAGWQAIASRSCIIGGGFRGAGFSGGSKYFAMSQGQSDFIFAVVAEKFGFLGTFLYLVLVVTLVLRIFWIARNTRKNYASYICIGIAGMILVQAAENIGMCLAILPVVGITCPFLSYGPSSLLSMYICIGIVESICTHSKKYYFERETD